MSATHVVRLLPVFILMFAGVGCDSQQQLVDGLKDEKIEVQKQFEEASEKANALLAENETLKQGVESAKAAAAELEGAVSQAKDATADAVAKAKTATEAAIAKAQEESSAALSKAVAGVEAKMASAGGEAKKSLDAANNKATDLQKQLGAANAKVAELEAALKKAAEATKEEAPAEEESSDES